MSDLNDEMSLEALRHDEDLDKLVLTFEAGGARLTKVINDGSLSINSALVDNGVLVWASFADGRILETVNSRTFITSPRPSAEGQPIRLEILVKDFVSGSNKTDETGTICYVLAANPTLQVTESANGQRTITNINSVDPAVSETVKESIGIGSADSLEISRDDNGDVEFQQESLLENTGGNGESVERLNQERLDLTENLFEQMEVQPEREAGEIAPGAGTRPENTQPGRELLPESGMTIDLEESSGCHRIVAIHPEYGRVEQRIDPKSGAVVTDFEKGPLKSIKFTPPGSHQVETTDPSEKEKYSRLISNGELAVVQSPDGKIRQFADGHTELTPENSEFKKIVFRIDEKGSLKVDRDKTEAKPEYQKDKEKLEGMMSGVESGKIPLERRVEGGAPNPQRIIETYANGNVVEIITPVAIMVNGKEVWVLVTQLRTPREVVTNLSSVDANLELPFTKVVSQCNGDTRTTTYSKLDKDVCKIMSYPSGEKSFQSLHPSIKADYEVELRCNFQNKTAGTQSVLLADGSRQITFESSNDPRTRLIVYAPNDPRGISRTEKRNGEVEVRRLNAVGCLEVDRALAAPNGDGVTKITETYGHDSKLVKLVFSGIDGKGKFTREEFEGTSAKGKITQAQYENGTVVTTFENGRIAKATYEAGPPPCAIFLDRSGNPIPEDSIMSKELVVKEVVVNGQHQQTNADLSVIYEEKPGVMRVDYPEKDPQNRLFQLIYANTGETETQFKDRAEIIVKGISAERARELQLDANDPTFGAVRKIIKQPDGSVRLEYDSSKLAAEQADLRAKIIFTSVHNEGVREQREYSGDKGRLIERDLYRNGEKIFVEGEGKETGPDNKIVQYYFRISTIDGYDDLDQEVQYQLKQKFYPDGRSQSIIDHPHAEFKVVEGRLGKGGKVEFRAIPKLGGESRELTVQELAKPLFERENKDGSISRYMAGGEIVTPSQDKKSNRFEFPPNDSFGRVEETRRENQTEIRYKNGQTELRFTPSRDGVVKQINYAANDSQQRIITQEFVPGADSHVLSQTTFRGQNGQQLIQRIVDGQGGWTAEREIIGRDGKRISIERNGSDEQGSFTERVANGVRERRWDNGRFRMINDTTGETAFEGKSQPFAEDGNKGFVEIDEKTGNVLGVRYTDGSRKGDSYSFSYTGGKISSVTMVRDAEGKSRQEITITVDKDGTWLPPGTQIPGFTAPADKNGKVKGEFTVRPNGDILFDHGDGKKEILSIDGSKKNTDLISYSRTVEKGGATRQEYWDGYSWREPASVSTANGVTTVTFKEEEGKPKSIVRDGLNDTLTVEFGPPDAKNIQCNWKTQTQTWKFPDKPELVLFNTGETGPDDKPLWMEGKKTERKDGSIVVDFVAADKTVPKQVLIAPPGVPPQQSTKGSITAVYPDGAVVTRDRDAKITDIRHPNGISYQFQRNAVGDITSITSNGAKFNRRGDVASGADGNSVPRWTLERPGQPPVILDGEPKINCKGRFELSAANGDGLVTEPGGRMVTRSEGRITTVQDRGGQVWIAGKPDDAGSQEFRLAGDTDTVIVGKPKLFENGSFGIETTAGIGLRNLTDKSISKFNQQGIETERKFDNGACIRRDDEGRLQSSRDKDGNLREFKWEKPEPPAEAFIQEVTLTPAGGVPRVVEVGMMGRTAPIIRVLKDGADPANLSDEQLGDVVEYDKDSLRRAYQIEGDQLATETDLHGYKMVRKGNEILTRIARNPADNSEMVIEANRLKSATDATGRIKRSFEYGGTPPNDVFPTVILENSDGRETRLALSKNANEASQGIYEIAGTGEKVVFNRGIPASVFDYRFTGDLTYQRKEGDKVLGSRIETVKGETLIIGPETVREGKKQSGEKLAVLETATGNTKSISDKQFFVYDQTGKLTRVEERNPGPPPLILITDEVDSTGKLRSVKNANSADAEQRYEQGECTYNHLTGTRMFRQLDGTGAPSGLIEIKPDGTRVISNARDVIVREELPDKSCKTFHANGVVASREYADGSKILYTNNGELSCTVGVDGIERRFSYSGDGANKKICKVETKKSSDPDAAFVVTEALDKERKQLRLLGSQDKAQGEDKEPIASGSLVTYPIPAAGQLPDGTRRVITQGASGDNSKEWTEQKLDGTIRRQPENGPLTEIKPKNKEAERAGSNGIADSHGLPESVAEFRAEVNATLSERVDGEELADGRIRQTRYLESGGRAVETYDPGEKSIVIETYDKAGKLTSPPTVILATLRPGFEDSFDRGVTKPGFVSTAVANQPVSTWPNHDGTISSQWKFVDGRTRTDTLSADGKTLTSIYYDSSGKGTEQITSAVSEERAKKLRGKCEVVSDFGHCDYTRQIAYKDDFSFDCVIIHKDGTRRKCSFDTKGTMTTTWYDKDNNQLGNPKEQSVGRLEPLGVGPAPEINRLVICNADGTRTLITRRGDGHWEKDPVLKQPQTIFIDSSLNLTSNTEVYVQRSKADGRVLEGVANSQSPVGPPAARILPDGKCQLVSTLEGGGRVTYTLNEGTSKLTVQFFDAKGVPTTKPAEESLGDGVHPARIREMLKARHQDDCDSIVHPDGTTEKIWKYPDGTMRIDTLTPNEGVAYPFWRVQSVEYGSNGKPLRAPVDLYISPEEFEIEVRTRFTSKVRPKGATNGSIEGRIYPDGRMEEFTCFKDGTTVLRSYDPKTSTLTETFTDRLNNASVSTRALTQEERMSFAKFVESHHPAPPVMDKNTSQTGRADSLRNSPVQSRINPDGTFERRIKYSNGLQRIDNYNPSTDSYTQRLIDGSGNDVMTPLVKRAESHSISAEQRLEVNQLAAEIATKGTISESLQKRIEKLLAEAEKQNNRSVVQALLQDRVAEGVGSRIVIRETVAVAAINPADAAKKETEKKDTERKLSGIRKDLRGALDNLLVEKLEHPELTAGPKDSIFHSQVKHAYETVSNLSPNPLPREQALLLAEIIRLEQRCWLIDSEKKFRHAQNTRQLLESLLMNGGKEDPEIRKALNDVWGIESDALSYFEWTAKNESKILEVAIKDKDKRFLRDFYEAQVARIRQLSPSTYQDEEFLETWRKQEDQIREILALPPLLESERQELSKIRQSLDKLRKHEGFHTSPECAKQLEEAYKNASELHRNPLERTRLLAYIVALQNESGNPHLQQARKEKRTVPGERRTTLEQQKHNDEGERLKAAGT